MVAWNEVSLLVSISLRVNNHQPSTTCTQEKNYLYLENSLFIHKWVPNSDLEGKEIKVSKKQWDLKIINSNFITKEFKYKNLTLIPYYSLMTSSYTSKLSLSKGNIKENSQIKMGTVNKEVNTCTLLSNNWDSTTFYNH
jgi:hypothetical protein